MLFRNVNWYSQYGVSSKLNIELPDDTAIEIQEVIQRNESINSKKDKAKLQCS